MPLSRQPEDPRCEETVEQVVFDNPSSYLQGLPYDRTDCAVFVDNDYIQPSVVRYDNLKLPPTDE